jgi:hypothetical protein
MVVFPISPKCLKSFNVDYSDVGSDRILFTFEKYGFPGQDECCIWSTPNGDKVGWFKDHDGNTLSLRQHPKR